MVYMARPVAFSIAVQAADAPLPDVVVRLEGGLVEDHVVEEFYFVEYLFVIYHALSLHIR